MANQLARVLVDGEAQDREVWQDDLLIIIADYYATFKMCSNPSPKLIH